MSRVTSAINTMVSRLEAKPTSTDKADGQKNVHADVSTRKASLDKLALNERIHKLQVIYMPKITIIISKWTLILSKKIK